jgi:CBS domain-containing protein
LIEINALPLHPARLRQLVEETAMNAGDIMTRRVISATRDTTIAEAADLMLRYRISGLPVIDEREVVIGIVTEGDLLRRAEIGTERRHRRWIELLIGPGRLAREYVDAHARKVGEVMSEDVACVGPGASLPDVVRTMEKRRVKRLPVIDNDGRLLGIVSRADLVHALVGSLDQPQGTADAAGGGRDDQIREKILAVIAEQPWGPRYSVDIKVTEGVVDLYGSITDEYERSALKVAAENVAGVKTVRDHLVWVEPVSGFVLPIEGSAPPPDAP